MYIYIHLCILLSLKFNTIQNRSYFQPFVVNIIGSIVNFAWPLPTLWTALTLHAFLPGFYRNIAHVMKNLSKSTIVNYAYLQRIVSWK